MTTRHRRGSAYVLVLVTTAIVTVIGLSGVMISRIELRRQTAGRQLDIARAAARAGVEFATARIRVENDWSKLGTGADVWNKNEPIGTDGAAWCVKRLGWDESDPINPRLTLESTGTMGDAVVRYRFVVVRGAYLETEGVAQVID